MPPNLPKILIGFILIGALVNLIQAGFTELDPDEAYYWMYAQVIDWGYFDHPPAVAVMIRLGYSLFPTELGVRLFSIILQAGSWYLFWLLAGKPAEKKSLLTLMLLVAAMPFLQVYGFITTPDSPLLFFSLLYFLAYKSFTEKNTWGSTLLLGISMAALLYSKYHGILLIFFTVLSNIRLFLQPRFYIASIFGACLFFPHLWWQYLHDFPSFRYHLEGRDDVYKLKYTTTYLLNQLLIFSPLLFPLLVQAIRKTKFSTPLFKAFLWIMVGFWVFFLWSTTKGHAEPQWTAVLSIPLVLIAYQFSQSNDNYAKWLRRLSIITIVLMLIARTFLMVNWLGGKNDFHDRAWIDELREQSEGLPIILENSYRDISKYNFYTGEKAVTITNYRYRKNQFDLWGWEKQWQGQKVLMVLQNDTPCPQCFDLQLTHKGYKAYVLDTFQTAQACNFEIQKMEKNINPDEPVAIQAELVNPYEHDLRFYGRSEPLKFTGLIFRNPEVQDTVSVDFLGDPFVLPPKSSKTVNLTTTFPGKFEGEYDFHLGIRTGPLPPSINSRPYPVRIQPK